MSTLWNGAAVVVNVYRTSVLSAVTVFPVIAHIQCQAIKGRFVSIGRHQFTDDTPREIARWEAAVNELLNRKYIEFISSRNGIEIYRIVKSGFDYTDSLKK